MSPVASILPLGHGTVWLQTNNDPGGSVQFTLYRDLFWSRGSAWFWSLHPEMVFFASDWHKGQLGHQGDPIQIRKPQVFCVQFYWINIWPLQKGNPHPL